MSTYRTVRGKSVTYGACELVVDNNGDLYVQVTQGGHKNELILPEPLASEFYNLLGDVMEWESSHSTTEAAMEKLGDAADAKSGELDDINAASNK